MGDLESERKMVISIMKSIIVSVKGGLPFNKLDGDYREQNGQRIPYSKFGFKSLEDFVRSISEVRMSKVDGSMMLTVVDPKMAHIKSLLDRQKPARKRIRMPKRGYGYTRSNYTRPVARPTSKVQQPRPGGCSYRPTVSVSVAPRRPPPVQRELQAPPNGGRERGHGDGPRLEHNTYSRPPASVLQSQTSTDVKRVAFRPEQVAYSNTHAIRQGKGFVEYIPLDNPQPPKSEVRTKHQAPKSEVSTRQPPPKSEVSTMQANGVEYIPQNKLPLPKRNVEDNSQKNITTGSSPLSEKYSEFLRQIAAEQASSRKLSGQPERNGGRGRGGRKPDEPVDREIHARPVDNEIHSRPVDSEIHAQRVDSEIHARPVDNGLEYESHDPANRTVEYIQRRGLGDVALTVTIANDFVADDDDDDKEWSDYDEDELDEDSYVAYHKLLLRPKFRNHQLIGDDFLLHFANYIDEPCQEIDGRLSACGLCISGQTVSLCVNDVYQTDILSDRVILLVGAVDIVQGMDFSTLKLRMISLLTELMDKNIKRVYVCTVPPLVGLSETATYVRNNFNKYIRTLESETIRVIDLDTEPFVDKHNQLCAKYFKENVIQTVNPRLPSIALRMWNRRGLETLRTLIQRCLG